MMFLKNMLLQSLKVLTVQVNQPAAFLAFAMEAQLRIAMAFGPHIFKAGRAVAVDYVFVDNALVHQIFQLAINRGLADGRTLGPKIVAYVTGSNVNAPDGFKVTYQPFGLFCLIFWS